MRAFAEYDDVGWQSLNRPKARYTLAKKSTVADTVDCDLCCRHGRLCCPNVERPFDFVASVYRA